MRPICLQQKSYCDITILKTHTKVGHSEEQLLLKALPQLRQLVTHLSLLLSPSAIPCEYQTTDAPDSLMLSSGGGEGVMSPLAATVPKRQMRMGIATAWF
jgi:hypothetical protein